MDPFSPPAGAGDRPTGSLDLGTALSEGFFAGLRGVGPLLAGGALLTVAYVLAFCTCVGWIAIFPLMTWGMYAFTLSMIDGHPRIDTLWSGTQRFGFVFGRMWLTFLLLLIVGFPILLGLAPVIGWTVYQSVQGQPPDPFLTTLAPVAVSGLWGFVMIRFMAAPFLVVERDTRPFDAFQEAWSATAPHWGKLAALQVLFLLLAAPATVMALGNQLLTSGLEDDPSQMLTVLAPSMALQLASITWSMFTSTLLTLVNASVYRQIFGPAPAQP